MSTPHDVSTRHDALDHTGIRPARRILGLIAALLAIGALGVGLVFAVGSAAFQLRATTANGEIVAVQPIAASGGPLESDRYQVTVEFPDQNGQFRRFGDVLRQPNAPEKGDEVPVMYDPRRPVEARVGEYLSLWWQTIRAGGVALIVGILAEELLRGTRRTGDLRGRIV